MDNSEDIIRKLNEISQKIDSLERRLDSLQELSRKGEGYTPVLSHHRTYGSRIRRFVHNYR
jgi:hypothetical protein